MSTRSLVTTPVLVLPALRGETVAERQMNVNQIRAKMVGSVR